MKSIYAFTLAFVLMTNSVVAQDVAVGGATGAKSGFGSLSAKIDTLMAMLNALNGTVNAQQTEITDQQTEITSLQSEVNRLQADNNRLKGCGDKGKIYDPDGSGKDAQGCVDVDTRITSVLQLPKGATAGYCTVGNWRHRNQRGGKAVYPAELKYMGKDSRGTKYNCSCVAGFKTRRTGLGYNNQEWDRLYHVCEKT